MVAGGAMEGYDSTITALIALEKNRFLPCNDSRQIPKFTHSHIHQQHMATNSE